MGVFGAFEVRLDPWEAEYGGELGLALGEPAVPDDITVDLDVEQSFGGWRPIAPVVEASGEPIIFIDGVRRLDARVILRRGSERFYGAFGSFATGWVEVAGTAAQIPKDAIRVRRLLVVAGGVSPSDTVSLLPGLTYAPASTPKNEADAPLEAIQAAMIRAEGELAVERRGPALVISDGRISFHDPAPGVSLGYVKRMLTQYLPGERGLALLAALPAPSRTPIFQIEKDKKRTLSWYVRLSPRERGESDLSGIARLECAPMPVGDAVALADRSVAELARFVPKRSRDPRSPQNLLPIGALERQMRRRLGDRRFVRRKIRAFLAQEEIHG
jgi:hypothetical protein